MDIKELRIGNLIERNGVTAKIELINNEIDEVYFIDDDFYYNDFCCNINPIPLTKELILKFGFEDSIINKNSPINCYEFDLKNQCLYILTDGKNRITISRFIKYVHQLQNLYFSLTGEELTIK